LEGPTPALLEALERLEGMRVAVQNAQAAGPITQHGELYAIPDRGAGLEQRTHFGGARGSARQKVYDLLRVRLSAQQQQALAEVRTGDVFRSIEGVLSYQYGDYQIEGARLGAHTPSGIEPEVTHLVGDPDHLTIATYNVHN